MSTIHDAIIEVLRYYGSFRYPLSGPEIRRYLHILAEEAVIQENLNTLLVSGIVVQENEKYCLKENQNILTERQKRMLITKKKLQNAGRFIHSLTRLPWVTGVALTGSCAMDSAIEGDDVDLFIITSPRRLFLSRLVILLIAQGMGVRRRRKSDRYAHVVCLNLFFDQSDLQIPEVKRNKHSARELVQMRVIYERGPVFSELLHHNMWIYEHFPNAQNQTRGTILSASKISGYKVIDWLDTLCKKAQMALISRHKTNEYITDTQLWFHPVSMIE